jgi:uncharacterized membrane protein
VSSIAVERRVQRHVSPSWLLTLVVTGLEIPYPLVHGATRNALTVATVLVFACASLVHASTTGRTSYALALLLIAGLGGLLAEILGVHTGIPFGTYTYAGGLGPKVLGVPLVVGLAWLMMAHPASSVAARLAPHPVMRWLVAAWALASWDVFLDPQMVNAHHWSWQLPAAHLPGIDDVPLSNFGGWLLVAIVLMAVLTPAAGREPAHDDGPAIALWTWTWLSSTLANLLFFHRPAVAAWGFLAMGLVGIPLAVELRRTTESRAS